MLILTEVLFGLFGLLVLIYLLHIRPSYEFFIRLNIPGPSPRLFFGNFIEILKNRRASLTIHNWTKKYGRIFGYFEGHTPILVISDPDILQEVFIKSFSKFHSRRRFPIEDRESKDVHMFSATGLRWKRQRFVINPTFSSTKLKQMTPIIDRTIGILMKKLTEESKRDQSFDIYAYYKRFTMDTIWSCGFGLETDMQNNINDPYLLHSKQVIERKFQLTVLIAMFITELAYFCRKFHYYASATRYWLRSCFPSTKYLIAENSATWIVKEAKKIIEQRQKVGRTVRTDLLQLMLQSMNDEDFIRDAAGSSVENDETGVEAPLIRKLTKHEIASNVFLFMVAGYETTSTALAYVSYVLATHPEEQRKLQEHIDFHLNSQNENEIVTYDTICQMDYLDMFIRETLRMYPIVPAVLNRQSSEDFHIEGVGTIPAGTRIAADIHKLHYDPELWGPVDPKQFYPERFETKRHPMAWIPFGAGPRNCIGMRFALVEMKMAIVHLLKTFTLVSCGEETDRPFKELQEIVVIAPREVRVRLQRRSED